MVIRTIDRPRIPNASLKVLHRLGRTLLRDRPEPAPVVVHESAVKLDGTLVEVHSALVSRIRDDNPSARILAGENEFDRAADVNWVWLRKLLEGVRDAFGHPGLSAMPPALQAQVNLPKLRRKAQLAGSLHEKLFGSGGTNWVSSGWVVQSETMAAILSLIESDGLGPDLAQIAGEDTVRLLEGIQPHYEDIVSARMSRDSTRGDNFRPLVAKLRWRLEHYRNAVETMRDPDDPVSFEIVDRALRSLLLLAKRSRGGAASAEENDDVLDDFSLEDEGVEQALDELDAQVDSGGAGADAAAGEDGGEGADAAE